ncbi:transmembrane protein 69 [Lepeophtheirus salmonis]|uniref:transmembrane protein 69 n=1 Tax=Lepeophtheirus salmonis TaxID=72036 RepID=UPI001AE5C59B|nr:transmembrane protein 69-like [Lepeophtheirus salmonis]
MSLLMRLGRQTCLLRSKSLLSSSRSLGTGEDMKKLFSSPKPPLVLGIGGIIPFYAPPLYMMHSGIFDPSLAGIQLAYGASILSFLGGVRWGTLVQEGSSDWIGYTISVGPSLVAWICLLIPSTSFANLIFVGGLGSTAYLDITQSSYPSWFRGLRILLTTLAIVSVFLTSICSIRFTTGDSF